MATRSLSPKQILERTQQHRQAVMLFARLAAKRAVQAQLLDAAHSFHHDLRQAKRVVESRSQFIIELRNKALPTRIIRCHSFGLHCTLLA
jgi:hypothetical protein